MQNRKILKWGQWDELNKELGLKRVKKVSKDNDKKRAQRRKFTKCKVCGGTMTYIPNSNIFVCENEVEKTEVVDGISKKIKVKCGNTNYIDRNYIGYINYLFN